MKRVIERLERAMEAIKSFLIFSSDSEIYEVSGALKFAIKELKTPRWETPEQWEKRTGEPWPDNWAVYALYENNDGEKKWFWGGHSRERERANKHKIPAMIVCATEAGRPPDDWKPEEENNAVE